MQYDVIIVGGAMAGATLALALSAETQGAMRIAVLEKQTPAQHNQSGFDARCIALSDGSCRLFDEIRLPDQRSLWQTLQTVATPIRNIHVSDKGHSGIVEFDAQEFHLPQLGAVIALSASGDILLEAIRCYPNIDYLAPVEIENIQITDNHVDIALKNHRTLQASLLVGADGTRSQVASAVGIAQECVRQYEQTAIIANIAVQQAHQNRAFERFTAEGPLALLPFEGNLMTLVWCVKNSEELLEADDAAFLQRLQQRFGWRLGKLRQCGRRSAYPLNLYRAERHIHTRTALIGNAAQTLHPIAGQGFNLGIRDVMTLSKLIANAYKTGDDIGAYAHLQQYERIRRADQQQIIGLTDGLVSIFANDLLPLQIGRNLGLAALSLCSPLKRHFAKPTLGRISIKENQ
ncbi:2-octaprenyl-6-methoxyphenyl hydroxylase [Caviibacterium pharyngocola]|uniref:2-octaprenyl-6-methoxyphenyl hydroxylase n=1 Tax=Caviibacterium pharyngocola TaxID=28159 RepID=A0A2M8RWF1_9PAST|nr:2-octaprenyl-6-methoxyphenyl hydroxylase [Caviibacterium pharyngocola]PJG83205.1 2-octaprenyl-6-methoxyphenyl hydroxylase [Caviibacterium pharyngocola]